MHVHVWLSPFALRLKLSEHCLLIGSTPIQNKKYKKSKENFTGIERMAKPYEAPETLSAKGPTA